MTTLFWTSFQYRNQSFSNYRNMKISYHHMPSLDKDFLHTQHQQQTSRNLRGYTILHFDS